MSRSLLVLILSAAMLACVACSSEPAWVKQEKQAEKSPASLQGHRWICVGLDARGADPREPLSIEFLAEGRVQGFAGINRFGGTWSAGEGTLELGSLAATRMGGPGELMDLERRFLETLSKVRGFSLQGGLLRLKDGGGRIVLEFSR